MPRSRSEYFGLCSEKSCRRVISQPCSGIVVGDEAYETLFRGAPAPEASRFCELPMDKLRPFFTADIGFHPYPPEKLKAFSQQLAEQGIYERVTVLRLALILASY